MAPGSMTLSVLSTNHLKTQSIYRIKINSVASPTALAFHRRQHYIVEFAQFSVDRAFKKIHRIIWIYFFGIFFVSFVIVKVTGHYCKLNAHIAIISSPGRYIISVWQRYQFKRISCEINTNESLHKL